MTDTTPAPTVWPCLSYSNEQAAIRFLVEAFGFEETLVVPGDRDARSRTPNCAGPKAAESCSGLARASSV